MVFCVGLFEFAAGAPEAPVVGFGVLVVFCVGEFLVAPASLAGIEFEVFGFGAVYVFGFVVFEPTGFGVAALITAFFTEA